MEGCRVFDDSQITNVFLKNESSSLVLESLWVPNSSPSINGSASMVNFEDTQEDNNNNTKKPIFLVDNKLENCNEEFDKCFYHPDKKRRLTPNQVQFLEKSFEIENKLEPDRKIQLAKEIGLQPRQVAIWFQNRRARYKSKVLEKEYDSLKASFDKLKKDYDDIHAENEKLKNEVHLLTQKMRLKEKGNIKPEPCDPISPLEFQPKNPISCQDTASNVVPEIMMYKQDDAASSAKSDVFDSDSPHYTSKNVFDQQADHYSDFSQDEDDSLRISLLHFPKIEEDQCYDDDLQPNSCNLGFPAQDQGTWFWQY